MNRLKLMLLTIAFVVFAANAAFASLTYDVTIDTSSLSGTGYLYFQYTPVNAWDSTVTVSGFSGGTLASARSTEVNGSAVTGLLPGSVIFANTNGTNDYNQGITFGNSVKYSLSFSNPISNGSNGGSSTFSLGLYQDESGLSPLLGGTLYTIDLMNNGAASTQILASGVDVTPTPIPAAVWLLGSGLTGLIGIRRKMNA